MNKAHQPILYRLKPADLSGHRFSVSLTIPEPQRQGQILALPAWIPGSYLIRDFSRHIESIQAWSGRQRVALSKINSHAWRAGRCNGPLRVEIVVYAWDLSVRGAHLDETHGFFNGTSVFLMAKGFESHPCRLTILPPDGVSGWHVYTSMRTLKGKTDRRGFGLYQANDYDDLIDHPVEMGKPQTLRFKACGSEHVMVFTGLVPNLDLDRIGQDVKKICESHIRLFEPDTETAPILDSADRYVFMTMVTGDGYGGLEHRASTALMAARKDLPTLGHPTAPEGYQTFLGLVSHEYFHTWHVKRIKPAAFVPYDLQRENHTRLLWIFEGFTSYYDDLMLLRSGVITEKDYFKALAKQISSVMSAPGRKKQSVAQSSFDAWTRYYKQDENAPNAIVSYYAKGALVALAIDLSIRARSQGRHSMDDVMRLMWETYGRHFYQGQPKGVSESEFARIVDAATGVDLKTEIHAWTEGTEDLPLEKLLATQGIRLQWKEPKALPVLNVKLKSTPNGCAIASAIEGGAAHLGGLSAHDVLVAIGGVRIDDTPASVDRALARHQAGETVPIHVFRRDELRCFDVRLGEPASSECQLVRPGAST